MCPYRLKYSPVTIIQRTWYYLMPKWLRRALQKIGAMLALTDRDPSIDRRRLVTLR